MTRTEHAMLLSTFGAAVCLLMGGASHADPLSDEAARQHKLDLQERCAAAAEKNFRSSGWKTENGSAHQSHYNQTLGVCLIELDGRQPSGGVKSVSDAIEGRTYALYMWGMTGQLLACQLIPSQKEKRDCTGNDEYEAFAASLMEQQ